MTTFDSLVMASTSCARVPAWSWCTLSQPGGVWCFLGHGASSALLTTIGAVPGLRWATWLLNYVLLVRLLDPIDRLVGLPSLYPCDYVLLARKP